MEGQLSEIGSPISAPRKLVTLKGFTAALCAVDLALLLFLGLFVGWLRFGVWLMWGPRALVIVIAGMAGWLVFRYARLHDPAILGAAVPQFRRALTATGIIFFLVLAVGYLTKTTGDYSRPWVGAWFLATLAVLPASRLLVVYVFRKLDDIDAFVVRYVLLSNDSEARRVERFVERWQSRMPPSHQIAGVFIDGLHRLDRPLSLPPNVPKRDFAEFAGWSERASVDRAIAIMPVHDSGPVDQILGTLREMPLDVDIVAGEVDQKWATRAIDQVAGLPVIRIMSKPLSDGDVAVKRAVDLAVTVLALVLLAPLLALIALAIRLDTPGPVLFRQARLGFNNIPFIVLKFRTMHHEETVPDTVEQAKRNDPRVTRVGAFLRKTSLDELPQLFNVLRGDMSIVGPRPLAVEHNRLYAPMVEAYLARHRIKPGMTGWAQVNGFRGETDTLDKMNSRIEHDLYYVDNWSLVFDLEIMVRTVAVLVHPNAY